MMRRYFYKFFAIFFHIAICEVSHSSMYDFGLIIKDLFSSDEDFVCVPESKSIRTSSGKEWIPHKNRTHVLNRHIGWINGVEINKGAFDETVYASIEQKIPTKSSILNDRDRCGFIVDFENKFTINNDQKFITCLIRSLFSLKISDLFIEHKKGGWYLAKFNIIYTNKFSSLLPVFDHENKMFTFANLNVSFAYCEKKGKEDFLDYQLNGKIRDFIFKNTHVQIGENYVIEIACKFIPGINNRIELESLHWNIVPLN